MNKLLARIIASILYAIMLGLLIKYTNVEVVIVTLLIQIHIELLLKDSEK